MWRKKAAFSQQQLVFAADTSETVVLFVSAQAVLELFSCNSPNAPAFVKEFGIFLFPK